MPVSMAIPIAAVALSLGIAVFVMLRASRSFAHRLFALGMALLALDQALFCMIQRIISPVEVIQWYWIRTVAGSLLPCAWLTFSLSFSRSNYREFLKRWRWIILGALVFPLTLLILFKSSVYVSAISIETGSGWLLRLGWAGYAYNVFLLLATVVILVNLEKTLRSFTGSMQWQIKFLILGILGLFAVRIYTISQALLYSYQSTSMGLLNAGALIVASAFIALSLYRSHLADIEIYLSQTFLVNSVTFLVVGVYLIAVGIVTEVVSYFGENLPFPIEAFVLFIALMLLAVFLLSGALREKYKSFLIRHLKRPRYDYRKEWTTYTRRTLSLVEINELAAAVTKMAADTFGDPAVSIWLVDDAQQHLTLAGSTFHSAAEQKSLKTTDPEIADVLQQMRGGSMPQVLQRRPKNGLSGRPDPSTSEPSAPNPAMTTASWCCAPLTAAGEFIGIMTLSEKLTGEPYTEEDMDLIKTVADQTAGAILNLKYSERLRVMRQMETFQTISAFFVHDLKNLASTLSLTLQNLPIHFDNPEFREDALRTISHSVNKINNMCGRLSTLSQKIELHPQEVDLNELVAGALAEMNGSLKGSLNHDLHKVPKAWIDPEQIRKVVTNLVLNAGEAVGPNGKIWVETAQSNGWVVLSVRDNGCGISQDFLEKSLFRPFKTTKKKGLGIGLFHCKQIVEAHHGRIEVESEEGKGAAFRVLLPGRQ
jgi:putative PEP-CTERM system histidine kinase